MSRSGTVVLVHGFLLLASALVIIAFRFYRLELGYQSLQLRATLGSLAALLLVVGAWPFVPWFCRHLPLYLLVLGLPALAVSPWYYFSYLPPRSGTGVAGELLAGNEITESAGAGLVATGFAYPIFTPTIRLVNRGLFTREVDIYLHVLDGDNEAALFRAVRAELPDTRLSVEASVHGLLSESDGYFFIPVFLPPLEAVEGRVVFIIRDLNDGSTFRQALDLGYPVEFQVRDSGSGELLRSFPMADRGPAPMPVSVEFPQVLGYSLENPLSLLAAR